MPATILVVEDDHDTAFLLRDLLRKRGFDVEAVHSALECIAHLETRPVDLVLTDVEMAGMSGIELCETLKLQHPDTVSLVVTGGGGLATAMAAVRAGAHDFITKPVREAALAAAITKAIDYLDAKRARRRPKI